MYRFIRRIPSNTFDFIPDFKYNTFGKSGIIIRALLSFIVIYTDKSGKKFTITRLFNKLLTIIR